MLLQCILLIFQKYKSKLLLFLAKVCLSCYLFDDAINAYKRIIEIDNENIESYHGLCDTYIRIKQYDKAEETCNNVYSYIIGFKIQI